VNFPKPIITHEPESQMAIKYGNVTLTCQAATGANSPLTIEWKKDNVVGIWWRNGTCALLLFSFI